MLLRLADGTCDTETGAVSRGGRTELLTPKERALLDHLARRMGEVVSTEELLREVWGYAPSVETRAVFHTCRRLRAKIEADPSAPTLILAERGAGYRLVAPVAPAVPARTPALRPPPAERNRFFGREAELDGVAARFSRGDRLVTLVGVGGMGKTRLATHFALTRWSGPCAFCDLGAARTGADVAAALLASVGAPPSAEDAARAVAERLGAGLLVVDNAESALADAAGLVGACLDAAAELRVLVTSRAPLALPGEARVALFGLDPAASVALVVARAEGELGDAAAVDAVVARLGGIPLALELAAARTALVGPGALRALLEERGRSDGWLRALDDPADAGRHGQMTAVLDGTWALLPGAAGEAMGRLAVFEGGVSLPAAEAVVPDAASALGVLVRAGLIRRSGEARFTMLPPVQAYARGRLGAAVLVEARDRHADWVRGHYASPALSLAARREDRANLLAACEWAIEARRPDLGRLVEVAWRVLTATGGVRRAAELARAAMKVEGLSPEDRVRTSRVAMFGLRRTGDLVGALDAAAEMEGAARALGDPGALAQALSVAGYLHYIRGEHALAEKALLAAHAHSSDATPAIRGAVKVRLGTLRRAEGRFDEALGLFEGGVALIPQGTPDHVAGLCRVADTQLLRGDLAGARAAVERAGAALPKEGGGTFDLEATRMLVATESGAFVDGERHARRLLAQALESDDLNGEVRARVTLSIAVFEQGRSEEALDIARAAVAARVGAVRQHAVALGVLGWIEGRLGVPGAETRLAEAEALLGDVPTAVERRELDGIRADLALHRGDREGAGEWLRRADACGAGWLRLEAQVRAKLGE